MRAVRSGLAWVLLSGLCAAGPVAAAGLDDFGFGNMKTGGVAALGQRPLLTILASFGGKPAMAHDRAYYDNLVFNVFQQSVNGYYLVNSNARFYWRRAGEGTIGPFSFTADEGNLPERQRLARVKAVAMESGFDFAQFDDNGDGKVTTDELSILIIDNLFPRGAANRDSDPIGVQAGGSTVSLESSMALAGHQASLMSIVHELSHSLGTVDLYGSNFLSQSLTLMGPTIFNTDDDRSSFHLDPWHKMQLGWSEPRIRSLADPGSELLPAANLGQPDAPVILYDPARGANEYFMIEYRTAVNQGGFQYDENVANNGLVIWHVEQDGNKQLLTVPSLVTAGQLDPTMFAEGAPDFVRGGNIVWESKVVTPVLRWLDGSSTGVQIQARAFHPADSSIIVDWCADGCLTNGSGQATFVRILPDGGRYQDLARYDWERAPVTFMSYSVNGQPHFLAHNPVTGVASLTRILSDGGTYEDLARYGWEKDPVSFMPFSINGQPYFLAHNPVTGVATFTQIMPDGGTYKDLARYGWEKAPVTFMPYSINGQPYFLAHNPATGGVSFTRILPDGGRYQDVARYGWEKAPVSFMPYSVNGQPYFLAHNPVTGVATFVRILPDGGRYQEVGRYGWEKAPLTFMPFSINGQPYFLAHNPVTGVATFTQIMPDGRTYKDLARYGWHTGSHTLTPYTVNGQPHVLIHQQ